MRLGRLWVVWLIGLAVLFSAVPAGAAEVSFTDAAGDAYRTALDDGAGTDPPATQVPNSMFSDPSADILEAGFSSAADKPNRRSYSVRMTITGPADPAYSYVVAGGFGPEGPFGPDCQLYHLLTPGTTSAALAFCGSGEDRRQVGRISGSAVTLNGNTLSASYTYMAKRLPAELAADTTLGPLFAYTCVSGDEGRGCRPYEKVDTAESRTSTFTI